MNRNRTNRSARPSSRGPSPATTGDAVVGGTAPLFLARSGRGGDSARPMLTAVLDGHTRLVVGWHMTT